MISADPIIDDLVIDRGYQDSVRDTIEVADVLHQALRVQGAKSISLTVSYVESQNLCLKVTELVS